MLFEARLSVDRHRSRTLEPNASAAASKLEFPYHVVATALNLTVERNGYADDESGSDFALDME